MLPFFDKVMEIFKFIINMIVVPFNQHLPQQFPSNIKPDTAVTYNSNENFGIITFVVKEKQTTQKNPKGEKSR